MNANQSATWHALFGYPPEGVFVIIDPQVGEPRGQLRALPLLAALGLPRFTFVSTWRSFELVPYEYTAIHEGKNSDDLDGIFPICQFVSQAVERASPSDVTKKLLMAQRATSGADLLVYVMDSEQFMLRDSVGTKTFVDEYILKRTISYDRLFARYYESLGRSFAVVSTGLTLNLALHQLAWELHDETLLRRLSDLFDFRRLGPESWAWELLERLARIPDVREDESALYGLLRPWVDHDITWIGRRLYDKLQEFNFEPSKIRAERARLAAHRER